MKAMPLMLIQIVSLIIALAFVASLNFLFWLSFIAFGITSAYVAIHKDRLCRELDEFFN